MPITPRTPYASGRLQRITALGILAVISLTAASCNCSANDKKTPPKPLTRLTVDIADLPAGKQGNVAITGPEGFRKQLAASATLTVQPGTYQVTAKPIKTPHATRLPVIPEPAITLADGQADTARVTYASTLPDATKVMPGPGGGAGGTGPSPLTSINADGTKITVRPGPYTNALKPGMYVVSGATRLTPKGMAAWIRNIDRRPDAVHITGEQVPLTSALGEIVLVTELGLHGKPAPAPPVEPNTTELRPVDAQPAAVRTSPPAGEENRFGTGKLKREKTGTMCGVPIQLGWESTDKLAVVETHFKPRSPINYDTDALLDLKAPKPRTPVEAKVKVTYNLDVKIKLGLRTDEAFKCKVDVLELVDANLCALVTKAATVGAITINCTATLNPTLQIQVDSPFSAYLQVDMSDGNVTVGYNNDNGLDFDVNKPKASFHPKIGLFDGNKGKYSLEYRIGPRNKYGLELGYNKLAALTANVEIFPSVRLNLDGDLANGPDFTLRGGLTTSVVGKVTGEVGGVDIIEVTPVDRKPLHFDLFKTVLKADPHFKRPAGPVAVVPVTSCSWEGAGQAPSKPRATPVPIPSEVKVPPNMTVYRLRGGHVMLGQKDQACTTFNGTQGHYRVGDEDSAVNTSMVKHYSDGFYTDFLCGYFPEAGHDQYGSDPRCAEAQDPPSRALPGAGDVPEAAVLKTPTYPPDRNAKDIKVTVALRHADRDADVPDEVTCTALKANYHACTAALTLFYLQYSDTDLSPEQRNSAVTQIADFVRAQAWVCPTFGVSRVEGVICVRRPGGRRRRCRMR